MTEMKFRIFLKDTHYFNDARMATALGLRRTQNGQGWTGWVRRADLDILEKGDYKFRVLY